MAIDRTTACVLLAAGGGSRFAGPTHKLLARLGDEFVAERAIRAAVDADVGDVVVVTGAVDLEPVLERLDRSAVTVVHHAGWADGQATSLQAGIDAVGRRGAEAAVVGLADQPFVDAEAWRLVAASDSPIAVATYDGRRRNPVRLHRSVWASLPSSGDEGARSLMRVHPELVEEIPCPGSPADIDTQEDLPPWPNRS